MIRKIVFWTHLAVGLAAGSVILMMSVTGVLLTYQKQTTDWADRAKWGAENPAAPRASIDRLLAGAQSFSPDSEPTSLTVHRDGRVSASIGQRRVLYLDRSTGEALGLGSQGVRSFFSVVTAWHRWFAVTGDGRSTARAITGASNLVFLFLVLSGLWLWVPRRWTWRHVRPHLLIRRGARGKVRDLNWHHVFGFWAALPLVLVVASATVISYPWASDLAYRLAGDVPPVRGAASAPATVNTPLEAPLAFAPVDLERIVAPHVGEADDWRSWRVSLPADDTAPLRLTLDAGWGGEPQHRRTVTFQRDGGVTDVGFEDNSRGRRFRTFLRFAHTGEFFGLWGQTVAGIASLLAVLLVWTGFALAWRRFVRWVKPTRPPRIDPAPETDAPPTIDRAAPPRVLSHR